MTDLENRDPWNPIFCKLNFSMFFGDQFIIRVNADITDISNSRGVF